MPPPSTTPQPPTVPPPPPLQIYFWEFQLQNETERLRTLFLPELGIKLKNLTGYTTYMISVAAFNAAGDGPRSLPTRGRTQQAGEGGRPAGQIQMWRPRAALRRCGVSCFSSFSRISSGLPQIIIIVIITQSGFTVQILN